MATKLSASQLYQAALAAGFDPAAAAVMSEIELAESGGDVDALGDTKLEDSTWGPSVGAPQIRTLKSQTGTGGVRDIEALSGDINAQDAAAYQISSHGTNFSPWSTFNSGAYARYASTVATATGSTGSTSVTPVVSIPGLSSVSGTVLSGARGIMLEAGAAIAGLVLVGLGAYRLAAPARAKAEKAAGTAAKVALL